MEAVDGFISPHHTGSGGQERSAVGAVRPGVDSHEYKTIAVIAIHPNVLILQHKQVLLGQTGVDFN